MVDVEVAQDRLDAVFGVNADRRAQLAKGAVPREIVEHHKRVFAAPLSRSHAFLAAGVVLVFVAALTLKSLGKNMFLLGFAGVVMAMAARVRLAHDERAAAAAYRASLKGGAALRVAAGDAVSFRTWQWGPGDMYVLRQHFQLGDERIPCPHDALAKLAFRGPVRCWFFRGPAYGAQYPMIERLIAVELGADASVSEAPEPTSPPSEPFKSDVPAD